MYGKTCPWGTVSTTVSWNASVSASSAGKCPEWAVKIKHINIIIKTNMRLIRQFECWKYCGERRFLTEVWQNFWNKGAEIFKIQDSFWLRKISLKKDSTTCHKIIRWHKSHIAKSHNLSLSQWFIFTVSTTQLNVFKTIFSYLLPF